MLSLTAFVIGLWIGVGLMCLMNLSGSLEDENDGRDGPRTGQDGD